jgi:hypothetical protein
MEWDEKEARLAIDMLEPVIADIDKPGFDSHRHI